MTNNFITNQDRLLSEVFNNILPSASKLHFLVGFFYFSGFEQIYENVQDKQMRVLVGLEIEKDIFNKVKEFEVIQAVSHSRGKIRDNFNKSFVQLFNDTEYFDSEEKQAAFRIFLNKIKDGSLEIRKTLEPNHAKLYIFEKAQDQSEGGEYPGSIITGSSNLTRSGLGGRHEINVISRDKAFFLEGKKIFDDLWESSVVIADKGNIDSFLVDVVEKVWIDKLYRPYLLYVRVLEEYFSESEASEVKLPAEITNEKYLNLKYQVDAIRRALNIIEKHSGVLISDVVGLGKSIIASAVAHNLRLKTVIISPPHLKDQWDDYRLKFDFNAKVYGGGSIDKALEDDLRQGFGLVIVDEAHKYRNAGTLDYGYLHQLCQNKKVVLLTATPFNNRPQDIFSMISLFQIPARSTIQTVETLTSRFKDLVKEYNDIKKEQKEDGDPVAIKQHIQELADKIRDILSPVLIRRTRLDLLEIDEYKNDLQQQKIIFPKVNPPQSIDYKLGKLAKLYKETLELIAPTENEEEELATMEGKKGFIGARYKPVFYLKNIEKYRKEIIEEFGDENLFRQSQVNIARFMRRLLVRRYESSIEAFKRTLSSMIDSAEQIKKWYENGKVPIYKKGKLPDYDFLFESTGEDLDEELADINYEENLKKFTEKGLKIIDSKEFKKSFIEDVEKDIKLLKSIRKQWVEEGAGFDPKIEEFIKVLKEKLKENPKRKIIVFSEFADTVNYLYGQIQDKVKAVKYTSADASSSLKKAIRANFDASEEKPANDYDILIGTDAISEGVNLNRAGIVFNYDIPYNPTRVIQRIGRINRISKKVFDDLYTYNFFPTAPGEVEIGTKRISTLKIAVIQTLMGADAQVLTDEEEIEPFLAKQFKEATEEGEHSWDTKYLDELKHLQAHQPEIVREAKAIPKRVRIQRTVNKDKSGVIVFGKKGANYVFKYGDSPNEESVLALGAIDGLKLFEAEVSEKAKDTSKGFEIIYQNVKQLLFRKKTQIPSDTGRRLTLEKLIWLRDNVVDKKDYFIDLLRVVEELDALPDHYEKVVRAVDERTLQNDITHLMKLVPHAYLTDVINKAQAIDEGEESLILAEELI